MFKKKRRRHSIRWLAAEKYKRTEQLIFQGGAQMACKYFIEDYFGFCGITAYSHIPHISELEQLCFKDFQACWIYNEYESSHVRVGAKEPSNSTQQMQTRFEHRNWEDITKTNSSVVGGVLDLME